MAQAVEVDRRLETGTCASLHQWSDLVRLAPRPVVLTKKHELIGPSKFMKATGRQGETPYARCFPGTPCTSHRPTLPAHRDPHQDGQEIPRPYTLDNQEHMFSSRGKRHSEVGLRAWAAQSPARRGAPSSPPGVLDPGPLPVKSIPCVSSLFPHQHGSPAHGGTDGGGCSEVAYRVGARSSLVRSHRKLASS